MEAARIATHADLQSIDRIVTDLKAAMVDHRGGDLFLRREAREAADLASIEAAAKDANRVLVVGTFDGVVLGYGLAQIEQLHDQTKLGRLDGFAVDTDARGVGIGEAMMMLLQDLLRTEGCFAVDSQALPGDRHTKNFFESFGLKARLLTVSKLL